MLRGRNIRTAKVDPEKILESVEQQPQKSKKERHKRIDPGATEEYVAKKQNAVSITDESVMESLVQDIQNLLANIKKLQKSLSLVGTARESLKLWSKIRSERKTATKLHDRIQRCIDKLTTTLQFMLDMSDAQHDVEDVLDPNTILFKREQLRKIAIQFESLQVEYEKTIKNCQSKEDVLNREQQKQEVRAKQDQDEEDLFDDDLDTPVTIKDVTPLMRAMSTPPKRSLKGPTRVVVDSDEEGSDEEGMSFFEFLAAATEKKKKKEQDKQKETVEALKKKGIDAVTRDIVAQQLEKKKQDLREKKANQLQEQEKKLKFILSSADQSTFQTELAIADETNKELRELELEFLEVHEAFQDLNYMIKDQQHGINIIMHNVDQANQHILAGIENIREAKNLTAVGGVQNMARKVGAMVTFMK
jgi:hypothetical protein